MRRDGRWPPHMAWRIAVAVGVDDEGLAHASYAYPGAMLGHRSEYQSSCTSSGSSG